MSVQNVEMYEIARFLEEGLQFTMTSVVDSNINIATLFGLKGLLKSHNSVMKKHSDSKDHHWLSGIFSEAYFGVLEFFGWILQADRCLLIR